MVYTDLRGSLPSLTDLSPGDPTGALMLPIAFLANNTLCVTRLAGASSNEIIMVWNKLIRFVSGEKIYYGQPIEAEGLDFQKAASGRSIRARVLAVPNGIFGPGVAETGELLTVDKLLAPLARSDVPAIKCIGLNYKKHSQSRNLATPCAIVLNDMASLFYEQY